MPCQNLFLWKALDFVEANILVWRAKIDLVKNCLVPDLGALYWIEGSSTSPLCNCKGDEKLQQRRWDILASEFSCFGWRYCQTRFIWMHDKRNLDSKTVVVVVRKRERERERERELFKLLTHVASFLFLVPKTQSDRQNLTSTLATREQQHQAQLVGMLSHGKIADSSGIWDIVGMWHHKQAA